MKQGTYCTTRSKDEFEAIVLLAKDKGVKLITSSDGFPESEHGCQYKIICDSPSIWPQVGRVEPHEFVSALWEKAEPIPIEARVTRLDHLTDGMSMSGATLCQRFEKLEKYVSDTLGPQVKEMDEKYARWSSMVNFDYIGAELKRAAKEVRDEGMRRIDAMFPNAPPAEELVGVKDLKSRMTEQKDGSATLPSESPKEPEIVRVTKSDGSVWAGLLRGEHITLHPHLDADGNIHKDAPTPSESKHHWVSLRNGPKEKTVIQVIPDIMGSSWPKGGLLLKPDGTAEEVGVGGTVQTNAGPVFLHTEPSVRESAFTFTARGDAHALAIDTKASPSGIPFEIALAYLKAGRKVVHPKMDDGCFIAARANAIDMNFPVGPPINFVMDSSLALSSGWCVIPEPEKP